MIDPVVAGTVWTIIQVLGAATWLYITYCFPSLSKQAGVGIIFHLLSFLVYAAGIIELGIFIGLISIIAYGYPIFSLKKTDIRSRVKDPAGMYNMMTIIFESIPVPMFIKDSDMKMIMVNKAFTDAFGLKTEDFENRSVQDEYFLWGYDEAIEAQKTDNLALDKDEPVIRKASLYAPKPQFSILDNPGSPHDYIIVKKSYKISNFGDSKGIVGMAINSELIDAKMAEIEHMADNVNTSGSNNEIKLVIDILNQMDKKMDGVIVRVGFLEQRNEAHHIHIKKNTEILEKLLKIKKELRQTIGDADETWEVDIDPNKEHANIAGVN